MRTHLECWIEFMRFCVRNFTRWPAMNWFAIRVCVSMCVCVRVCECICHLKRLWPLKAHLDNSINMKYWQTCFRIAPSNEWDRFESGEEVSKRLTIVSNYQRIEPLKELFIRKSMMNFLSCGANQCAWNAVWKRAREREKIHNTLLSIFNVIWQ